MEFTLAVATRSTKSLRLGAIFLALIPFATFTYGQQGVPSEMEPMAREIFTAALDLVVAVIALLLRLA